jgi:hypothetical protein
MEVQVINLFAGKLWGQSSDLLFFCLPPLKGKRAYRI